MSERPTHLETRYKQRLTPKQEEVLALVARGLTNFEIAQRLGLSLEGVKYHVSEILAKLEVESREEAAAWWRGRQRPWSGAARWVRGLVGLPVAMRVGLGVAGVAAVIGVAAGVVVLRGDDAESLTAEGLLEESREVMATESFSYRRDSEGSIPDLTLEFAPADRLKVSFSTAHGGDYGYPFYFYDGTRAYYSQQGERWIESGDDGEASMLANQLILDPRMVLRAIARSAIEGSATVEGRDAHIVGLTLDADRYVSLLPPSLGIKADGEVRGILGQMEFRLWIDVADRRVLKLGISTAEQGERVIIPFDYSTPVRLPAKVESLDGDGARDLAFQAEKSGEQLLNALSVYRAQRGKYPQHLDETIVPNWPRNVFTGQPIRESDGPGDFEYRVKDNGANMEFKLFGWDGISVYQDSAQFGHGDPGMGQRSAGPP